MMPELSPIRFDESSVYFTVGNSSDAVKLGRQAKGDQILLKIWRRQGNLAGTCYLSVDNTKIGK